MNTLVLIESSLNTTWYLILMTFLLGAQVPIFIETQNALTRIVTGVAFICLTIGILSHPLVGIL